MQQYRDEAIFAAMQDELKRQQNNIELIASENLVSEEIMQLAGSVFTNKYAEGYPGKRYYGGCINMDVVESLAKERICQLFGCEYANVQPHSGAQANTAVYLAVLKPGDRVLGMSLADGGHLTHGSPYNYSGMTYEFASYGVSKETEMIDYDALEAQALEFKPKLIVAGASAYARTIDFKRIREICDACGAMMMVDIAHIAALVATGEHPSPVPYADFVTTTTHKTLRGPRGGVIMCKEKYAKAIDKAVFPGMQGGPLMHIVAAKAACFYEALQPSFKEYAHQIILNAKALENALKEEGFRLVSNGTDNHLILVDVRASCGISGKKAERLLDEVNITVNKNAIPFDTAKTSITSGIRVGVPAMTTRGFKEDDFKEVAAIISKCLKAKGEDEAVKEECKARVQALVSRYPIYEGLSYLK